MKFYRESFRRLSRLGTILLILSAVLTVILGVQNNAGDRLSTLGSVMTIMPVLPYYVFAAGFGFALAGFSFLNKRSESDFYHSIPISRSDLYLSITLAALTWMVGTIVVNALLAVLMMGIFGVPFVPAYLPLGIGLFIAAAMLVFAATAIGCSLTGTLLTNVVMAGLVLFLPRFILFILARGIVTETQIIGWLDLPRFLRPDMNAAAGLVAMLSRQMFMARIANIGTILYSIGLAVLELFAGWLLFRKRPSELAEQGARNKNLQTVFACLLTLPVLLLSLVRIGSAYGGGLEKQIFNTFTALMVVAALAVYVVYQIIVLRNTKKVLASLPFFLCPLILTAALFFVTEGVCGAALNARPTAGEIDYVVFEGYDSDSAAPSYTTLLLSEIPFREDGVKQLVSDTLTRSAEAVAAAKSGDTSSYGRAYSEYETIERIRVVLKDGRTLRRGVTFENINVLNDARAQNIQFNTAIRALPADVAVKYRSSGEIADGDVEKLRDSYTAEMQENGFIIDDYYRPRVAPSSDGRAYSTNEEQSYGSFSVNGYVGERRFAGNYYVRLETPRTASLYMMLSNRITGDKTPSLLKTAYDQVVKNGENGDYVMMSMVLTNVPVENGDVQQINLGYYANVYDIQRGSENYARDFAEQMLAILQRGTLTNDAKAFNVGLSWDWQYKNQYSVGTGLYAYYAFSAEDAAALVKLAKAWQQADYNGGVLVPADDAVFEADSAMVMPTPTPMPAAG